MKIKLLFIVIASVSQLNAQLLTGFGTGQFTQTSSDFTTNTQSANDFNIIGNDLNSIYGSFTPVAISANLAGLSLIGSFSGTASGNFQIELFDSGGDSRTYQTTWGAFNTLSFLSQSGAFNGTAVSMGLLTTGTGTGTINLTMDSLTAIPEPSTYALLALGLGSLVFFRMRSKRRSV